MPTHWSRRRTLAALGGMLGSSALAGCGRQPPPQPARSLPRPATPARPPRYLLVIAHADDDLFFMNPDLRRTLRSGAPHLTVVTTCGEADGRNGPAEAGAERSLAGYQRYTAARYHGLRAAYAAMVLGDPDAPWQRTAAPTATGTGSGEVELCTLASAEQVQLLFLNLWDAAGRSEAGRGRLPALWEQAVPDYPTMVPAESPVAGPYRYTHAGLVGTLVEVFTGFQPTVVVTMDPDPDFLPDPSEWTHRSAAGYADHISHTATALFTLSALHDWWGAGGGQDVRVAGYRGYYNQHWPANLALPAVQEKERYLSVYAWADGRDCPVPAGCGDRKLGEPRIGDGYGHSTTPRWPGGTRWLHLDPASGGLVAFEVRGGEAVCWQETTPGSGVLAGPWRLGSERLLPHLAVTQLHDGGWQVFGLQVTLDPDPARQRRAVVTAELPAADHENLTWTFLGSPHDHEEPARRRGLGLPYVDLDPSGRLHLFARTFDRGLAHRVRDPGGWQPWETRNGPLLQDGLAVAGASVLAAGQSGLVWWGPDGTAELGPPVAAPPTVVALPAGGWLALSREAGTGRVLRLDLPSTGLDSSTVAVHELPGADGRGPIAIAMIDETTAALAARDRAGEVQVAWLDLDRPATVPWHPTGLVTPGAPSQPPALAIDSAGQLVAGDLPATGPPTLTVLS